MHVVLTTGRLVLRRFTADDVENLVALDADPEVMRYLTGGRPTPRSAVEADLLPRIMSFDHRPGGYGQWAALDRRGGAFLGWFNLLPVAAAGSGIGELGWRLRRDAWGKGYATEGARAVVDRAFGESGFERLVAQTMTVNTASRRVMEKIGMRYDRTFFLDWPEPIDGADHGDVEYVLTKLEWAELRTP